MEISLCQGLLVRQLLPARNSNFTAKNILAKNSNFFWQIDRKYVFIHASSLGALRRFKRKKIPQRWKVAFLEGIDEYIHPPKFQKLAIGGF